MPQPEIQCEDAGRVREMRERRHVTLGQVGHMDVVAHAGTVVRRIVIAEDFNLRPLPERDLHEDGKEIIGRACRRLADLTGSIRTRRVEVAEQRDSP